MTQASLGTAKEKPDTTLKYQYLIDKLQLNQPCPNQCKPANTLAYRFVRDTPPTADDFLPTVLEDEKRINFKRRQGNAKAECTKCSISLYDTSDNAKKKLKYLAESYKETFGGMFIAVGVLDETDGVASEPDHTGHFSFYEYKVKTTEIHTKFEAFFRAA